MYTIFIHIHSSLVLKMLGFFKVVNGYGERRQLRVNL